MTRLTTHEAVAALVMFGPRPDRPVQPIAVLAGGQRYGGFTSDEHARWFAERCSLPDPEIVHYTGEPPCSPCSPPS